VAKGGAAELVKLAERLGDAVQGITARPALLAHELGECKVLSRPLALLDISLDESSYDGKDGHRQTHEDPARPSEASGLLRLLDDFFSWNEFCLRDRSW
jgi:hypothetical protein